MSFSSNYDDFQQSTEWKIRLRPSSIYPLDVGCYAVQHRKVAGRSTFAPAINIIAILLRADCKPKTIIHYSQQWTAQKGEKKRLLRLSSNDFVSCTFHAISLGKKYRHRIEVIARFFYKLHSTCYLCAKRKLNKWPMRERRSEGKSVSNDNNSELNSEYSSCSHYDINAK